jgi:hypothetical protein
MRSQAQVIDDLNYHSDPRTQGPAKTPVLYEFDENGAVIERELPTHWEICPVCQGEGKHVNPAIDAGGISGETFAEDPEFAEDYMSGVYDVVCNHCNGRTTVRAVDWDAMSEEDQKAFQEQLDEEAYSHAEHMAEIRAGC